MAHINVYKVARGFEASVATSSKEMHVRVCNPNGEFPGDHTFRTADQAQKTGLEFAKNALRA